MEQIDEYHFISYEGAGDEWIWCRLDAHGPVVKTQKRVEICLFRSNYLRVSTVSPEGPEFEDSVVIVWDCEPGCIAVLRELLHLDVLSNNLL